MNEIYEVNRTHVALTQRQHVQKFRWVRRLVAVTMTAVVFSAGFISNDVSGNEPTPVKRKKYKDFSEVTKGAKKYEGLFRMYEVDDHLYAEIRPSQFNQMYLAPIAIARGMASAGTPLNFGDEWILTFRRVGDRVQLIRKNIHYEAPKGTPLARAVEQNFTDSVLKALPVVSINPGTQGVLIDFSSIFLTDFAQLGLGPMDRSRSSWHKVKAFKNNVELEVEATFGSRLASSMSFGDDGVVDHRGVTLVIHYSLAKRPSSGYKPRYADQRVGHFISATKDFSKQTDTTFVRRINRWRLEKANPSAKLSPPKKQLVWWVEDTVPHEYRPYVEEGILEWNKAFEKIGYRSALGVRWQNERDEFDPEDINYCTFRWITTPYTFAMSGLRADPITGEMIDGDVIFDASWIRAWKNEYALLVGAPVPTGVDQPPSSGQVLGVGEIISPIMAAKYGYGLPIAMQQRQRMMRAQGQSDAPMAELVPSEQSPLNRLLSHRLSCAKFNGCQCAAARRHEYTLAAMTLAARRADAQGEDRDKSQEVKLPEELIGQAIKEVVMHEVGHSLGLRHNFKASSMLSLDEINDTKITREKGMVGSVMDYNPLNVSAKGEKQGDYATTTIGPYDYWAIEYAYKPINGNEAAELKKIAARSPEPDLIYATDEDLYSSNDPLVNTYDLGDDNLRYAKHRIGLAKELMKNLDETVVRDGESWYRLRQAFSVLLSQYGNAAYLAATYVGGQYFSRDFKGGDDSRDPIVPVDGEKQRESLKFLVDNILQEDAYQFSPSLLRRLTTEHWYHWGSTSMMFSSSDFDINRYVLSIQQIVLDHCMGGDVLRRLQNQENLVDDGDQPLTIDETLRTLTDGIWTELQPTGKVEVSLIRRNLQRDYLRRLSRMVVGDPQRGRGYSFVVLIGGDGSMPADARSLARLHLRELRDRLDKALAAADLNDKTRAHFQESKDSIDKVLQAGIRTSPF